MSAVLGGSLTLTESSNLRAFLVVLVMKVVSPYWHKPLTGWQKTFIRAFFFGAVAFVVWLSWQCLDFHYPSAWTVLVLEVSFTLTTLGGALVHWRSRNREIPEPVEGLKVDVFITTFNEDVDILRRTFKFCRDMDYPHTTYVLDDGHRQEVKALAPGETPPPTPSPDAWQRPGRGFYSFLGCEMSASPDISHP